MADIAGAVVASDEHNTDLGETSLGMTTAKVRFASSKSWQKECLGAMAPLLGHWGQGGLRRREILSSSSLDGRTAQALVLRLRILTTELDETVVDECIEPVGNLGLSAGQILTTEQEIETDMAGLKYLLWGRGIEVATPAVASATRPAVVLVLPIGLRMLAQHYIVDENPPVCRSCIGAALLRSLYT